MQPTPPTAERRHGDGLNLKPADFAQHGIQSRRNVLKTARLLPVVFSRKVEDVGGRLVSLACVDKNPSWAHIAPGTGQLVRLKVTWVTLLEARRDAGSHDAKAIDRVNDRFALLEKEIALFADDHAVETPGPG